MAMPDEGVVVQVHGRGAALDMLEEIADLYEAVHAEPPYGSAPKFGRDRFVRRTREQALSSGWTLITARRGGVLVGFAFGFAMLPGAWWRNASAPPDEVRAADKFAVIELAVAEPERGRGLGRMLLDGLLADRTERYATLAVVIGADAYGMYLRWGWKKVAEFRVEPPFSDALLLPLRARPGWQGRAH